MSSVQCGRAYVVCLSYLYSATSIDVLLVQFVPLAVSVELQSKSTVKLDQ